MTSLTKQLQSAEAGSRERIKDGLVRTKYTAKSGRVYYILTWPKGRNQ